MDFVLCLVVTQKRPVPSTATLEQDFPVRPNLFHQVLLEAVFVEGLVGLHRMGVGFWSGMGLQGLFAPERQAHARAQQL